MAPKNPFNDGGQPKEQKPGDKTINRKVIRKTRITGPKGRSDEYTVSENDSRPDDNGTYIDSEMKHIMTDPSGMALPEDSTKVLAFSYSGLFISSPQEMALCTSWLHPNNFTRIIKIGFDGHATEAGAICDVCQGKSDTIYGVLFILCLVIILGIWKGAGIF
jgi:hypothetical protein